MNNLKRLLISSAALILFSGVALAVPVSARDGSQVSDNTTSSSDSSGTDDGTAPDRSGQGSLLAQQFRQAALDKIQQDRANHKEQTEAQRQKACDIRKANLTRKMGTMVKVANQYKSNIDRIYAMVKNFYTTKQLNVTNYSDLTAKVDAAQTAAADSITALGSLDVNIDCTSQNVADSVASFQQAVTATRDKLKDYRAALVDLITALKGASTASNSSKSSTTDNTNSTNQ